MTHHEMIAALLSIKLGGKARVVVFRARDELRTLGHLTSGTRAALRTVYSRKKRSLREASEARERGRISILRGRTGMTRLDTQKRQTVVDPLDLGF